MKRKYHKKHKEPLIGVSLRIPEAVHVWFIKRATREYPMNDAMIEALKEFMKSRRKPSK